MLASAFAHGFGQLESWILRRPDCLAIFNEELRLKYRTQTWSVALLVFQFQNLVSKKALELAQICHLESVAKSFFGCLKHLGGTASQKEVVDV